MNSGEHAMSIKPVVATLLQDDGELFDRDDGNGSDNTLPVCRYYLMGKCNLLDCMFKHEKETSNAVCKYWAWGSCSRKNNCIYLHRMPNIKINNKIMNTKPNNKPIKRTVNHKDIVRKQVKSTDMVVKLRLSNLKQEFNTIDSSIILNIFNQHKYNYDASKAYLISKYGKPLKTTKSKNTTITNNKIRHQQQKLLKRVGWVETGLKLNNLYKNLRMNAEYHAKIRNNCYMKAVDAYIKGDKYRAKELSKEGKKHDQLMKKLHKQASDKIFNLRNKKLPNNIIDLHGLHLNECNHHLNQRINQIRGNNGKKLDVLTGTGHHSRGRAKILPTVIKFCENNKIRYKEMSVTDGMGGYIRILL